MNRKEVRLQSAGLTFKYCYLSLLLPFLGSSGVLHRATFPDEGFVTVKADKKKTIRQVLTGVMAERGLEIDHYVAHLVRSKVS